jgi:pSer/pThr/pTyr-binding forkhead associated (FHA) protein
VKIKVVTEWKQIAFHDSRYLAKYGGRSYNLHEDVRYTVRQPSPATVVLCKLKATLEESQQVVIDNINADFAVTNTIALPGATRRTAKTSAQRSKYYLVDDRKLERRIELQKEVTIVGRDESCDVVIDLPHVSRRHLVLRMSSRGLSLKNLVSSNAVFVNDTCVTDGLLHSGDKLSFGGFTGTILQESLPAKKSR